MVLCQVLDGIFWDWSEEAPWTSCMLRIGFVAIIIDYGYGDTAKEIYNNQKHQYAGRKIINGYDVVCDWTFICIFSIKWTI